MLTLLKPGAMLGKCIHHLTAGTLLLAQLFFNGMNIWNVTPNTQVGFVHVAHMPVCQCGCNRLVAELENSAVGNCEDAVKSFRNMQKRDQYVCPGCLAVKGILTSGNWIMRDPIKTAQWAVGVGVYMPGYFPSPQLSLIQSGIARALHVLEMAWLTHHTNRKMYI